MDDRIKNPVRLCLCLLLCLCLTALGCGCWSSRELNDLAVVMAIGMDTADRPGEVRVTAQTAKAAAMGKDGGGEGPAYWNVSESGADTFSALRGMADTAGRQLYLAHNQILVFSREMAESGVQGQLDYFLRDRESRSTVYVAVSEGDAADLLDFTPQFEKLPAWQLSGQIKASEETGQWPAVDLLEFSNQLMERSRAPLAPLISLTGEGEEKTSQIVGTAVFWEDRMVGVLDEAETRGMMWVLGRVESAALEVPAAGSVAGVEVVSASAEMEPVFRADGGLSMRVRIRAEGRMSDQTGEENLADPGVRLALEQSMSGIIRDEVENAFARAKELGADVYGFGNRIHEEYPDRWAGLEEDWQDTFRTAELELEIDARIRSTGRLVEPAYPGE